MVNVIAYVAFQQRSTTGDFTISPGSDTTALQAPKPESWAEFVDLVDTLSASVPSGQMQLDNDLEATLRGKAETLLPAGDWTLGVTVMMNSCLSDKKWKPCDTGKKSLGFVVKFENANLLAEPYVIDTVDDVVTFQCAFETLIVMQVV